MIPLPNEVPHRALRLVMLALASAQILTAGSAERVPKPIRLSVRFVARSTAFRSSALGNEDVYLVSIDNGTTQEPGYAKLVDTFPGYAPSLSSQLLTSQSPVPLTVRRDPGCDVAFAHMLIRSAPSDPIALIAERMSFHSQETDAISPTSVLPCYRVAGKRKF